MRHAHNPTNLIIYPYIFFELRDEPTYTALLHTGRHKLAHVGTAMGRFDNNGRLRATDHPCKDSEERLGRKAS